MGIIVHNQVVRKNIALVKRLVDTHKQGKQKARRQQLYHAYVNRDTGEIALPTANEQELRKREWKPVSLCLHLEESAMQQPIFEVLEENRVPFHVSDIQPLASRIIGETIRTLNLAFQGSRKDSDLNLAFKQITYADIEPTLHNLTQKNMIVQTWHPVDRLEAEDLLQGALVGTFFFRKDEFASDLESQLTHLFPMSVECFTLTYLQPKNKISDKTIVKKGERWFIYNDDLTLNQLSFPNLDQLLYSFKTALKFPLMN